jgi:hypothetical protein
VAIGIPRPLLQRLHVIFARAFGDAAERALAKVDWVWTPEGPPQVGGLPAAIRVAFARSFVLMADERRLIEASTRARTARPERLD